MDSEKAEDAGEQNRHEDPGPVQVWLPCSVPIINVNDHGGEVGICPGVALPAGGQPLGWRDKRSRVACGQDIVSAMAVNTFGHSHVPQVRDFSVIGVTIGLQEAFMTRTALSDDTQFPTG